MLVGGLCKDCLFIYLFFLFAGCTAEPCCAGGERRRAALALALAHADLASSRGGVSCDLLVLDEVLQHLAGTGLRGLGWPSGGFAFRDQSLFRLGLVFIVLYSIFLSVVPTSMRRHLHDSIIVVIPSDSCLPHG